MLNLTRGGLCPLTDTCSAVFAEPAERIAKTSGENVSEHGTKIRIRVRHCRLCRVLVHEAPATPCVSAGKP